MLLLPLQVDTPSEAFTHQLQLNHSYIYSKMHLHCVPPLPGSTHLIVDMRSLASIFEYFPRSINNIFLHALNFLAEQIWLPWDHNSEWHACPLGRSCIKPCISSISLFLGCCPPPCEDLWCYDRIILNFQPPENVIKHWNCHEQSSDITQVSPLVYQKTYIQSLHLQPILQSVIDVMTWLGSRD